ncbi:hypothetical protein MUK42_11216 [Musa troglodytarum]|uniref:Uncharacterized protein n=1 Tax=Musa troglodytarum TaxID=320322 RepID=A0A9E7GM99_9LILI|nr:hypothetical protein MUK42_11216 [Musa troglodytarum]
MGRVTLPPSPPPLPPLCFTAEEPILGLARGQAAVVVVVMRMQAPLIDVEDYTYESRMCRFAVAAANEMASENQERAELSSRSASSLTLVNYVLKPPRAPKEVP